MALFTQKSWPTRPGNGWELGKLMLDNVGGRVIETWVKRDDKVEETAMKAMKAMTAMKANGKKQGDATRKATNKASKGKATMKAMKKAMKASGKKKGEATKTAKNKASKGEATIKAMKAK